MESTIDEENMARFFYSSSGRRGYFRKSLTYSYSPHRYHGISKRCRVLLCCLFTITTCIFLLTFFSKPIEHSYKLVDNKILSLIELIPHPCHYPILNPYDEGMMTLFADSMPFESCSWENIGANLSFTANQHYLFTQPANFSWSKDNSNSTSGFEKPNCCYRAFYRIDDLQNWANPRCVPIVSNVTRISEEFIEVYCKAQSVNLEYIDMFAFIPDKPKTEKRIAKFEAEKKMKESLQNLSRTSNSSSKDPNIPNQLSVIVFVMDSVSHMNFIRMMPKTRDYLLQNLSAIPLNGYMKVGENSLPNMVPLLSGLSVGEFKRECIYKQYEPKSNSKSRFSYNLQSEGNDSDFSTSDDSDDDLPEDFSFVIPGREKVHLDDCPFIWSNFSSQGYRTSYAEDQNSYGIFHMYWPRSFKSQPTDYYLRTLTHQLEDMFDSDQCQGSRLSFKVLLDNVVNTAGAFKNRSYFQFTMSSLLSHNDLGALKNGDEFLLDAVKELHSSGYLNNTAFILLSDHGHRQLELKGGGGSGTLDSQISIEDRMPMAYITLPKWFYHKFPLAMKNLKKNSDRLTTPYEMHHTLYEFMNLSNLLDKEIERRQKRVEHNYNNNNDTNGIKSHSLFLEVSKNKTCLDAGIPLHWCICHKKNEISYPSKNQLVQDAVGTIVGMINQFVQSRSKDDECVPLKLVSIKKAYKWKDTKFRMKWKATRRRKRNRRRQNQNKTNNKSINSNKIQIEEKNSSIIMGKRRRIVDKIEENVDSVIILEVYFTTTPGNGSFVATVVKIPNVSGWTLTEKVIRRNFYGRMSYCTEDQDIKDYCYCKYREWPH